MLAGVPAGQRSCLTNTHRLALPSKHLTTRLQRHGMPAAMVTESSEILPDRAAAVPAD